MYSIIGALFLRAPPEKFTQAISYLFFAAPEKYTLPTIPGAYLFAGAISPHPILNLIIVIAQVCWSFAFMRKPTLRSFVDRRGFPQWKVELAYIAQDGACVRCGNT